MDSYWDVYLPNVVEKLWRIASDALGPDHLLPQAFETALRSNDKDLMIRSLDLFQNCPEEIKNPILWGTC